MNCKVEGLIVSAIINISLPVSTLNCNSFLMDLVSSDWKKFGCLHNRGSC